MEGEGGEDGRREGRLEGERRGEKEGVGEKKEGRERWREKGREGEYKSFNICCKCSCAGAPNSKSYKKVLQFRFYVDSMSTKRKAHEQDKRNFLLPTGGTPHRASLPRLVSPSSEAQRQAQSHGQEHHSLMPVLSCGMTAWHTHPGPVLRSRTSQPCLQHRCPCGTETCGPK